MSLPHAPLDPILAELTGSGARLLRVELTPGKLRLGGSAALQALDLTFETGRLRIEPLPEEDPDGLVSRWGVPAAAEGAIDGAEEEPWWRLLGAPLVAAWALPGAPGAAAPEWALQFRADENNPRFVTLGRRRGEISVRCETREAWKKRLAESFDSASLDS